MATVCRISLKTTLNQRRQSRVFRAAATVSQRAKEFCPLFEQVLKAILNLRLYDSVGREGERLEQGKANGHLKAKEHLYEVDLMRAFIILGVVCVHIFSFYNLFAVPLSKTQVFFEGSLTALHFTRESFMYITGLVLFITYYKKPFRAWDFWNKRFKLIFIPYAAFTLIYILFEGMYLKGFVWSFPYLAGTFLFSMLTGHQFYLYYLIISMQVYILFPLFVAFMRKTERYHWWILAGSFVLELGLMWLNKDYLQNLNITHFPAWLYWLIRYRDRNILTYQFWFIAGAVFAVNYQQVRAFIEKHGRLVIGVLIGSVVVLLAHYGLDRFVWKQDETMSVLVLQPIMIPYSFVITMSLMYAGIVWSRNRLKNRVRWFSAFVKTAAAASFGVFLIHPLLLHFAEVTVYALHTTSLERWVLLPLTIAAVYGGAILIARGISSVPLLSYIVGQKSEPPRWLSAALQTASSRTP